MKVSQSSGQLAKVVSGWADGELARAPKRIGSMQYDRGFGCVGHFGDRNPGDESHFSTRDAVSA
jgi:hypothetical protein